jgi:hypothetical protein
MRRGTLAFAIVLLIAVSAFADKKDDFKKAASVNGPSCDLIPYSSLNSSCRDAYSQQRDWCTGDRERGCSDLKQNDPKDRETAKERRDNANQCIDKRKYVMSKFEDASSQLASESDSDPEIRELAKTIREKIDRSIEDHKNALREVENRRAKCDRVYSGRD